MANGVLITRRSSAQPLDRHHHCRHHQRGRPRPLHDDRRNPDYGGLTFHCGVSEFRTLDHPDECTYEDVAGTVGEGRRV